MVNSSEGLVSDYYLLDGKRELIKVRDYDHVSLPDLDEFWVVIDAVNLGGRVDHYGRHDVSDKFYKLFDKTLVSQFSEFVNSFILDLGAGKKI